MQTAIGMEAAERALAWGSALRDKAWNYRYAGVALVAAWAVSSNKIHEYCTAETGPWYWRASTPAPGSFCELFEDLPHASGPLVFASVVGCSLAAGDLIRVRGPVILASAVETSLVARDQILNVVADARNRILAGWGESGSFDFDVDPF